MTVKLQNNEKVEPAQRTSLRNKLTGPNIIKILIVILCVTVAVKQTVLCVQKLIHTPITTYTHFDFNHTIKYPSVTFCREPPYKFDKLREYGLFGHPWFTSEWENFNFSVPLDVLWRDITYEASDFFVQFGLLHEQNNLELRETIGFVQGRCYTLTPKIPLAIATMETGLSITLQHRDEDIQNPISVRPPGYHVYVHYTREPFTEVSVYNGGLQDYLFVYVGETIDVKLAVNKYIKLSRESEPCHDADGYNANDCTTQNVWNQVAAIAGCSGPWMETNYPPCDNYESMNDLIVAYQRLHTDHDTSHCPRFCTSYFYHAYVNDRHRYAWDMTDSRWVSRTGPGALQTQLFMYFNNMMVSVYEERHNYDYNMFLSDIGGSVGFFLGLSVIGLMKICGKLWSEVIEPRILSPKPNEPGDEAVSQNKGNAHASENIYQNQYIIDVNKLNSKSYFQSSLPRILE